jgi:hypothetical protein
MAKSDNHTLRHWARERHDDCRSVNCSAADANVLSDRGELSRYAVESAMAESMNRAGGMFSSLLFYPPAEDHWRRVFNEWKGS